VISTAYANAMALKRGDQRLLRADTSSAGGGLLPVIHAPAKKPSRVAGGPVDGSEVIV
jgi:hypothetical protein